jgi:hypothetical protein
MLADCRLEPMSAEQSQRRQVARATGPRIRIATI